MGEFMNRLIAYISMARKFYDSKTFMKLSENAFAKDKATMGKFDRLTAIGDGFSAREMTVIGAPSHLFKKVEIKIP